ncbi:uncharacterized protein LOC100557975 [Anolis carolinensis]|uniref:DUF4817 domain-containing protein n=1 Tax=Anolis carolinensis TaxID=28377 RepID=R4GAV2_ANOCA|nr:PREDICTED: uncharacterized protein LOC100557975 [Anolis carolinensis]XP_008116994.1 PREDICTED: uncharacterized protein LOC100557975 [Anolis carolinensis]|eukprot:XP_008116993.1 PREDICTED: uncharacterized protein LOC100557975 [Anolis carolinensis]
MANPRLTFDQRKFVLKWYWKTENVKEVQRQWRQEFPTGPPTRVTIARIRDKFETDGTLQNIQKQRSGRRRTSTDDEKSEEVLQNFEQSSRKSLRQMACETGVSKSSIHRILRRAKLNSCIPNLMHSLNEDDADCRLEFCKWQTCVPRLVHPLNEDDPDRRLEFCEWFQSRVAEDSFFGDKIIWSDEAIFKLNGLVERHNCTYWDPKNPHITVERHVHLPGLSVWCGVSSKGLVGPYFFDGTVTGDSYLDMLKGLIIPGILQIFSDNEFYFQHDGAPPHFQHDVRNFLNETFPDRWIGRRGSVEFPPRSPDLTPLDFFLWGYLKSRVYATKPNTLEELKIAIVEKCCEIRSETLREICNSVLRQCEQCIAAQGQLFEYLM